MAKQPSKISLAEDGDNFVLRLSGKATRIILSSDNVLDLASSALNYRQRIMSRQYPGAVFATPAIDADTQWDAPGENLLIQMRLPTGGTVIFELPPESSRKLAEQIQKALVDAPASRLTRQ